MIEDNLKTDEVCECCGQIFSCLSALRQHQLSKRCTPSLHQRIPSSSHHTTDHSAYCERSNSTPIAQGDGQLAKKGAIGQCCGSEIMVMEQRSMRLERECDSLFFMLRNLLQSTHVDEILRRKHEEDLENERIMLANRQISDYEARQIDALRAVAQNESMKAAMRFHRKEYSTSAVDDEERSGSFEDDVCNRDISTGGAQRSKRRRSSSIEINAPVRKQCPNSMKFSTLKVAEGSETHSTYNQHIAISSSDPRLDEQNAILLHPTQDRPLHKNELRVYIGRTILRLKSDEVTKSRIRMLAPSWMQIVDDVDIISAVEHLKGIGLLVPKERYSKCKKQSFDAYQKADFRAVRDVDQLLLPYGLQLSDVVNVQ